VEKDLYYKLFFVLMNAKNIAEEAFLRLFPKKRTRNYNLSVRFSKRFKGYNANVICNGKNYRFNLSYKWKNIDKEIVIGLIQSLLIKIFKLKKSSFNIELYNNFIKSIPVTIKNKKDIPILSKSFDRVNKEYFYGLIEKPNLKLSDSLAKLGSYDFTSDTISISKHIVKDKEVLDYVMYHEMLHKFHKFEFVNGRNYYHTKSFRKNEKEFKDFEKIEKRIKELIKSKRIKKKNRFKVFLAIYL